MIRTIIGHGVRSGLHVVARVGLMPAELLHRFAKRTAGFAELDHARLQVAQRALNEAVLLLVVRQEVMPERVLESINSQ